MNSLPEPTQYELLTSTRFDNFLLSLQWNNDTEGPSPFLLLPYHLDRLIDAAEQHEWAQSRAALTYDVLKSTCMDALADCDTREDASKAFKVGGGLCAHGEVSKNPANALQIRVTLSKTGVLTASASPIRPLTADPTSASFFKPFLDNASLFGPCMRIRVDSQPTPASKFTKTKTTFRQVYDDARSRAGIIPSGPSVVPSDVLLYNERHIISEASIYNVAFYRASRWVTPSVSTGCLPGVLRRWLLQQGRIHVAEDNSMLRTDAVKDGDWVLLFNGVQGCQLGCITAG